MCHSGSMASESYKKMLPVPADKIRGILKDCGLSREGFARLRGVGVAAVHSWMRPDRNAIPEADLRFLERYYKELQALRLTEDSEPSKQKVLEKIPSEIRRRGLYDPLQNLAELETARSSQAAGPLRSLNDATLVDELERRGWTVQLTRKSRSEIA